MSPISFDKHILLKSEPRLYISCCSLNLSPRPNITDFDGTKSNSSQIIRNKMNECLDEMTKFRSQHIKYANDYIHAQSRNPKYFSSGGSTIRGTGGTPFMRYLRKHRDETRESIKN